MMCWRAGGCLSLPRHGAPVRVLAAHMSLPDACKGSTQLTHPRELQSTKAELPHDTDQQIKRCSAVGSRHGCARCMFARWAAVQEAHIRVTRTGSGTKCEPLVPGLQLQNRVIHVLDSHKQPRVPCQEEVQLFQGIVAQLSSCRQTCTLSSMKQALLRHTGTRTASLCGEAWAHRLKARGGQARKSMQAHSTACTTHARQHVCVINAPMLG